tara:strand:+ start:189 stop:425 length:237 start_codon:yes stop_codon:yes gene_type:complete
MNLVLRPLEDPNGVTWSIIWCLVILLAGVAYYIYTIMKLAFKELDEESMESTVEETSTDDHGGSISNSVCDSSEDSLS